MSQLLYRFHGIVVQGFGRGSKQLGIPTANLPESVVDQLPERFPTGIYLGWANIGGGDVHKMVMSVGWNPFYNNTKKSMEVHIIHKFNEDFYGQDLRAVVLEYIRAERGFNSVDELITAIRSDISIATERLEEEQLTIYKHDSFLKQQTTNSYQGSNLPPES